MTFFDATGKGRAGGIVHVTESTSPTPVSAVTCPGRV